MSDTKFIVVRHGETVWNAEGRIQGHLDSELNEEGLAQALLVGERMAREPFDHFYCSDLRRALQTAQPIVKRSDKVPTVTPRLRERNLGIFQGLTSEECQHKYPQEYRRFHRREVDHVMPGGESVRQLNARVSEFFDELAVEHAGQTVLVVTHGGVLDALHRHVMRIPLERPRDFSIYNASLNIVRLSNGRWVLDLWGDISHLTRDAALDDF